MAESTTSHLVSTTVPTPFPTDELARLSAQEEQSKAESSKIDTTVENPFETATEIGALDSDAEEMDSNGTFGVATLVRLSSNLFFGLSKPTSSRREKSCLPSPM